MRIHGAKVLIPGEGLTDTDVAISGSVIDSVGGQAGGGGGARQIDASGLLLLPGIVDIHGDAFEHFLMPRSGVHFPTPVALAEVDRQLVANGITTAYHGVTYSWEPGLRGRDNVLAVMRALESLCNHLGCDTRVHLRYEMHNLDAEAEVVEWLADGRVGLLALNEHTDMILRRLDRAEKLSQYTERSGLDAAAYRRLVEGVAARSDEVPASVARIGHAAVAAGVPLASHDDETPAMRRHYRGLGSGICEFPCNAETAREAIAAGEPVVLGAPNVLRGGSHDGRLNAEEAIMEGLCTVLASDYYYPAAAHAAFLLSQRGLDLENAWALLSSGPARAVGLDDRGLIAPGYRADLVLIDPATPAGPAVMATVAQGHLVYAHQGAQAVRHPVMS